MEKEIFIISGDKAKQEFERGVERNRILKKQAEELTNLMRENSRKALWGYLEIEEVE